MPARTGFLSFFALWLGFSSSLKLKIACKKVTVTRSLEVGMRSLYRRKPACYRLFEVNLKTP